MYASYEEEYGLAKRAMSIYDRATQVVQDEDRFEVSPTLREICRILILFAALHDLYCEGNRELWLACHPANL